MTEDFDQVKKDDAAPAAAADETGAPAPETAAPAEPNGAPEPAEKKKKTGAGKKILVPAVIALCVVALFFVGLGVWGYSVTVSRRNLPNVYVGEVAVGGMTRAETEAALDALDWAAAESRRLTVSLPAETAFDVGYVRAGMAVGREEAVDAACAYGHDGSVFGNLFKYWRANFFATDLLQTARTPDLDYIRACVLGGQQEMNRRLSVDLWKADTEAPCSAASRSPPTGCAPRSRTRCVPERRACASRRCARSPPRRTSRPSTTGCTSSRSTPTIPTTSTSCPRSWAATST